MKCWKMNLRPGQASRWGPTAWRLGAIGLWAWKLRRLNGPSFTWPLLNFAGAMPERMLGRLYIGEPLAIKSRAELLTTIKAHQWRYLRADNGDLPDAHGPGGTALPRGRAIIRVTPRRSVADAPPVT